MSRGGSALLVAEPRVLELGHGLDGIERPASLDLGVADGLEGEASGIERDQLASALGCTLEEGARPERLV